MGNLFTLIHFVKLKNKNLGNTSQLILSILICIVTFIAVVCFFASSYPLAVGLCLLTTMALGSIYNSSLFIYNLYNYIRSSASEQSKALKAIYAANCFKYGIATLFGAIALTSFVLSVFFFPYLTTGILIGTGIVSGITLLVGGFYRIFNYFRQLLGTEPECAAFYSEIRSADVVSEYERLIDNLRAPIMLEPEKKGRSLCYYETKHRSQYLTNDLAKNRAFLLSQIVEKIKYVECEIEKNKGKIGGRVWMQEEKRIEKIDLLIDLSIFLLPVNEKQAGHILDKIEEKISISEQIYKKIMLHFMQVNHENHENNEWKTHDDFYQFFNSYQANKAFQSFFKNVSDVKDLYDAVKHHFDIEEFLSLKNTQQKIEKEREKIQARLKEKDPEIIKKLEEVQFTPYAYSEKFAEDYY